MTSRIQKLAEKTIKGEMWIDHTNTEYDREDIFLSPLTMNAKELTNISLISNRLSMNALHLQDFLHSEAMLWGTISPVQDTKITIK